MRAGNKDYIPLDKMIMATTDITNVCVNITTFNCDSDPLSVDKRFYATLSSRDPAVVVTVERATASINIRNSDGELTCSKSC